MNSRQRVEAALNHQQPDRVPLDLGASAVTGMHVSSVYKLRQALKLDPPGTPVKVAEPYQMLGEIAPDLQDALGVDVRRPGRAARRCSASSTPDWKPWTTFDGTPVLVPGGFNTEPEPNGDILMYPEGDRLGAAQRPDAQGRLLFRHHRPPGADRRREARTSRTTWRSSARFPTTMLAIFRRRGRPACGRESDRAILANFGGTAFGDIALVPAPWLKHPKGIRDVAEWYMSTVTPLRLRLRVFPPAVRDRPGEPGEDLRRGGRPGVGGIRHRHRFRHADRAVHQPGQPTASSIQPFHRRVNDWVHAAHAVEDVHPLAAARWSPCCRTSSTPGSTSSTRCSARRPAWTRGR